MRVRKPPFDFSNTPAHWAANPEFAQAMNASSCPIPHLERFLNRVMATARVKIKGDDPASVALREDISIFIRQEANHLASHAALNAILPRYGYAKVPDFEQEMAIDYERLLRTKSLKFLLAYCVGFETVGPASALLWLDRMDDMLRGADQEVVALWKWHLMEEFEHRAVCHDVYQRLYGGYFMRLYGLFYQIRHLYVFSERVRNYLLAEDRKNMTVEQRKQSTRRERHGARMVFGRLLPLLLPALSPFYSPLKLPEPAMYRPYMAELEERLDEAS